MNCPKCSGDCAGANPPVMDCPMPCIQMMVEFCGFLSADLNELHHTYPPFVLRSLKKYLAKKFPPPPC